MLRIIAGVALAIAASAVMAQSQPPQGRQKVDRISCYSWTGASITGPTNSWTNCDIPRYEPVVTQVIMQPAPPSPSPQVMQQPPIRQ